MSHWNHRVIESKDHDGERWLAIHEVHYEEDGTPRAYTANPVDVSGSTPEELLKTLEWMRRAVEEPYLTEADFEGKQ